MNKEIKIDCPEGYEIDKENSTFECIKFKPIKKELPKNWEEYCKTHPVDRKEHFIGSYSQILNYTGIPNRRKEEQDKNLLPSREYAEAMLALCQLIQLRDCYNGGWEPDWTNINECKYSIYSVKSKLTLDSCLIVNRILAFKTAELRDQFLENFKDLIEIATPLL